MFGRDHWLAIEPLFAYGGVVLTVYEPPTEATRWSAMSMSIVAVLVVVVVVVVVALFGSTKNRRSGR